MLEAKTLDLRFLLRGRRQPRDDIVIIAVDGKTENELGRWQSRGRQWLADMLDVLREGGAKTVGFDFTWNMVEVTIADPAFFGLVVTTTPPPGAKVGPGAEIDVLIGKAP